MLPFSLKIVWFVLCIVGTIFSWMVLMALGTLVGSRWVPLCWCLALTVMEGMFCLGMIWRMDPRSMPRAFCVGQTIIIEVAMYVHGGFSMAFCIGTNLHILKPKTWGNLEQSFKWRPIYILPVIVYPLVTSVVQIALVFKFDAIQPSDGMHCDATDPAWIGVVAHMSPAVLLGIPSAYLSVMSIRRVVRTLRHVERSRLDDNEVPRQMRHSEHHSFKQSGPRSGDISPSSPGRQPIDPALPAQAQHTRLNFHLPFFRQLQTISQTLAPPPPSPNPSSGWEDGRTSVASSSFPTFAPVVDKPSLYARHRPEDNDDIADVRSPWMDEDSNAPTSLGGHETPEELELDVKNQDDDEDGTYRLSYRENANTPSRVSHVVHVPIFTPQIQRLLLFQTGFTISTLCYGLSSIIDLAQHRSHPMPFSTHLVAVALAAWGPALVFGSLESVRHQMMVCLFPWCGR